MAKYEFITETSRVSGSVIYYTKQDGIYIDGSLSHDKDKAYNRFINLSCGVKNEPIIEVTETRYSITQ
jgi:hypothetical protein